MITFIIYIVFIIIMFLVIRGLYKDMQRGSRSSDIHESIKDKMADIQADKLKDKLDNLGEK